MLLTQKKAALLVFALSIAAVAGAYVLLDATVFWGVLLLIWADRMGRDAGKGLAEMRHRAKLLQEFTAARDRAAGDLPPVTPQTEVHQRAFGDLGASTEDTRKAFEEVAKILKKRSDPNPAPD